MLKLFGPKKKKATAQILLMGHEPDLVSVIRCRLEANNYKVITADNGQEGLETAIANRPDLILLDTNMPVINEYGMLEKLRKHPDLKEIPVIMCTSLCEAQDIAVAFSFGIRDCVIKPFDCGDLMEKITNALYKENVD